MLAINAIILIAPLFLIRFGLMRLLDRSGAAQKRAAFFPPLVGIERTAYVFYQLSNILIIIYPLFLKVRTTTPWFGIGLAVYCLGIVLQAAVTANYTRPSSEGINTNGLYMLSRNPMYVAYFIYFLGCVLLTRSIVLLAILAVFQVATHWIILSEERWCLNQLGNTYRQYMKKVRRYI